ncbi:MAG: DinB family protein [Chitinophagales bacterium]
MQTKQDIIRELEKVFGEITEFAEQADDSLFNKSIDNKWSIAQNLDHLSISNNMTAIGMNTPKMMLKQFFTIHRTPWNYEETIWQYQQKLSAGAKASLAFQPKVSLIPVRSIVEKFWKSSCSTLLKAIDNWSEEDLDTYILPHPLIGKMTVRELLFFTIYHVGHHLNTMKNIAEK